MQDGNSRGSRPVSAVEAARAVLSAVTAAGRLNVGTTPTRKAGKIMPPLEAVVEPSALVRTCGEVN